jgi:hypothetical protein
LEVLKLIEQGEEFEDYKTGDDLWAWQARRRARELADNPQVSWQTRRALKSALGGSKF